MTVERLTPDQVNGLTADEVDRFIESDFRIRSGVCPNGCDLMSVENGLQCCEQCKFTTNVLPEGWH